MNNPQINIKGKARVIKNANLDGLKQHLASLLKNTEVETFLLLLKKRLPPGNQPAIIIGLPESGGVPMVVQFIADGGIVQRFRCVLKADGGPQALFQELKAASIKSTALNVSLASPSDPDSKLLSRKSLQTKTGPKLPRGPIKVVAKEGILFETVGDQAKIRKTLIFISRYINESTGIGLASEITPAIISAYDLGCTKQQFSIFYKFLFQQGLLKKLPVKPLSYELTAKAKSIIHDEQAPEMPLPAAPRPAKTLPLTGLMKQVAELESQASACQRLNEEIARDEKALADKKRQLEAFQVSIAKLAELRKLLGDAPADDSAAAAAPSAPPVSECPPGAQPS